MKNMGGARSVAGMTRVVFCCYSGAFARVIVKKYKSLALTN